MSVCIKMGSDENHFNVSLTVKVSVARLQRLERGVPDSNRGPAYHPNALPITKLAHTCDFEQVDLFYSVGYGVSQYEHG